MPSTSSQTPSPKRHAARPPWRVLAKHHPRGTVLPTHQHGTGQLVYALSGVMLVETQSSRWTIPPQRALWIPAGHPHSIRMLSSTELRAVYLAPALLARCRRFERQTREHAIAVSPLVRELVSGLLSGGADRAAHDLMVRLLLHTLHEAQPVPTDLPMPSDERLRRAVARLVAAPDRQFSLGEMAAAAAMSQRTFTRQFTGEVGVSFRAWRQRARIIASLDLLATKRSVKSVSRAMGFASTAAYAAAFRAVLACTPDEFRLPRVNS